MFLTRIEKSIINIEDAFWGWSYKTIRMKFLSAEPTGSKWFKLTVKFGPWTISTLCSVDEPTNDIIKRIKLKADNKLNLV